MANLTVTENCENAFNTTGDKCLDLFTTINRDTSVNDLYSKFVNAWNEDPETCIKVMYNFRDIRSGKGEKRISHAMMSIIKNQKKEIYKSVLEPFVNLGYWKDLLHLVEMSIENDYDTEVKLFASMLKIDSVADKPSLCAKWAPSENSHFDKKPMNMTSRIQKEMNLSPRDYRTLLSSLRKKIHIIESDLSQKKYHEILFEQIPSKAHLIYREALKRNENSKGESHDERIKLAVRYSEYLVALSSGEKKVNFTGLMPHEIIKHLNHDYEKNKLLEGQWKALSEDTEKLGIFDRCLCVVDVSGSMSGQPMEVAVALGALISECAKGPFANKVITFSARPTFLDLSDSKNLDDKVNKIQSGEWGMNTDIEAVFKEILKMGKFFNLTKDQMPEKLFIFTDMQFDQVSGDKEIYKTLDKLRQSYNSHGYELPQIVCWNLRTVNAIPCESRDDGIVLLSGFSVALLKCVMESKDIKFTPISVIENIKEKYSIPKNMVYGKMVINDEEINKIKFKSS